MTINKHCPHCGLYVPPQLFGEHTFFCEGRDEQDNSHTHAHDINPPTIECATATAPVPSNDELAALTPRDFLVAFTFRPRVKGYGPITSNPAIRSMILSTWWNPSQGLTAEFISNQTRSLTLMHRNEMEEGTPLHILAITPMGKQE